MRWIWGDVSENQGDVSENQGVEEGPTSALKGKAERAVLPDMADEG